MKKLIVRYIVIAMGIVILIAGILLPFYCGKKRIKRN